MGVGAAIGGIVGGVMQARGASRAASAQTNAANRQLDYTRETRDLIFDRMDPFYQAGTNALAGYNYEMGLGERPQGYEGFTATPGYDFRLNQGLDAVQGSAAQRGGLFSGNTLQALNDYGQGMASQEYGNYMGRLGGMIDTGVGAASGMAQAATNANSFANSALGSIGNAQAAGAVGAGNAWNGAIGNALSGYGYMTQMNGGGNPFPTGNWLGGWGG